MFVETLVILLTIGLTHSHCPICHWHETSDKHLEHYAWYANSVFEEVANDVISTDRQVQSNCEKFNNSATKEILDQTRYTLLTPLADFAERDLTIEIRHKVIYIKAYKSEKKYTEIRTLPPFVNSEEAKYKLEDGTLKVIFPLKTGTSCDDNINSDVIHVPALEAIEINRRFGGD